MRYRNQSRALPGECDKFRQYAPTYDALNQGCYWGHVRVYVPPGIALASAGGGDAPVEVGAESGRTVLSTALTLRPGEARELTFSYRLPRAVTRDGRYSLTVRKQAGTRAVPLTIRLVGAGSVALSVRPLGGLEPAQIDASGAVYETDLLVDRHLVVGLTW